MIQDLLENIGGKLSGPITPDELNRLKKGKVVTIGFDGRERTTKTDTSPIEKKKRSPQDSDIATEVRHYLPDRITPEEAEKGLYNPPADDEVLVPVAGGLMRVKVKRLGDNRQTLVDRSGRVLVGPFIDTVSIDRYFNPEEPSKFFQIILGNKVAGRILVWDSNSHKFEDKSIFKGVSYHEVIILPNLGCRVIGRRGPLFYFIDPKTGLEIPSSLRMHLVKNLRIEGKVIRGESLRWNDQENAYVRVDEEIDRLENIPPFEPISLRISDYQKNKEVAPSPESNSGEIIEIKPDDEEQNQGGVPSVPVTETQLRNLRRGKEVEIAPVGIDEVVVSTTDGLQKFKVVRGREDGFPRDYIQNKDGQIVTDVRRDVEIKVLISRDPRNPSVFFQAIFQKGPAAGGCLLLWDNHSQRFNEGKDNYEDIVLRPDLGNRLIGFGAAWDYFVNPNTGEKVANIHIESSSTVFINSDGILVGAIRLEYLTERKARKMLVKPSEIPAVEPFILPSSWDEKKK